MERRGLQLNAALRVAKQFRELGPVDLAVEPHADPTARADVWRHEESPRRGSNHELLIAQCRLDPDGGPAAGS